VRGYVDGWVSVWTDGLINEWKSPPVDFHIYVTKNSFGIQLISCL